VSSNAETQAPLTFFFLRIWQIFCLSQSKPLRFKTAPGGQKII